MKKIFLSILLIFLFIHCFAINDTIPVVPRSNGSIIVQDYRIFPKYNSYLPHYTDTTTANNTTAIGNDYVGAKIFTTSDNTEWVRKSNGSSNYWSAEGSGFSPNPNCGLQLGTGIVSYDDSTLNFDVSPAIYALCCDNIPRTSPFTHVTLDSNDADDPRLDAIVLTDTGVAVLKGTPDPNPAVPELSNCEILLTTVLINAGDNVPANISQTIIYDENYSSEWTLDSKRNISVDTANTTFPAHLTHDVYIDTLDKLDNYLKFKTNTAVNLNDYSLLKFYITYPSTIGISKIYLTWYLDGVQKTITKFFQFSNVVTLQYQIFSIPISAFSFIGTTDVNTLQISFSTSNTHTAFYIDWIQLQSGLIPISTIPGIQQLNVTGNALIAPTVSFPTGTNTTVALPFTSIIPHGVLYNPQDISAQPVVDTFDVSVVKGYLPITNLPAIPAGYYIGSNDGITNVLLPITFPAPDTIAAVLPLRVSLSGDPSIPDTLYLNYGNGLQLVNDSLYLGGTLAQMTTLDLNDNELEISSGGNDMLDLSPSAGVALLGATTSFGYGTFVINSGTDDNSFSINAVDASNNQLVIFGSVVAQSITFEAAFPSPINVFRVNGNSSVQMFGITATQASAITPIEGLLVFVTSTNGTFTSIGLWDYENSGWHKL